VRDVAEVVAWLLATPQVNGVFNLGSGQARSFEDLARAVFAAAGQPAQIDYIPMPTPIRDHYQYFTEARMERLADAGYSGAFTSLEDGVADYVRSYLATDDPYR
jgi:ADP-L-glycero-D-manno-heptose 6-epimerase